MKYAWNMGTDIESFNEHIIEFFVFFFLDNTGMKISVQLWTSSDDCGKFCYRYSWIDETLCKVAVIWGNRSWIWANPQIISSQTTHTKVSQRTHDAKTTSLWRQNDVATSHWGHYDVIIASCACWVPFTRRYWIEKYVIKRIHGMYLWFDYLMRLGNE